MGVDQGIFALMCPIQNQRVGQCTGTIDGDGTSWSAVGMLLTGEMGSGGQRAGRCVG
jgi:hypothetical protein